jgi:c-di-GMP-binding flagellar brake protein YcgR
VIDTNESTAPGWRSFLGKWLCALSGSRPKLERRQFVRHPFHSAVEIRTKSGGILRGAARDLSEGGIGVIVYGELMVGEIIWLKYGDLTDQGGHTVVSRGVVRQRHGYRYGFEFQSAISA